PDFVPSQIAALVQFFPVKAGAALGVAHRGDEEDDQLQALGPCEDVEDASEFCAVVHADRGLPSPSRYHTISSLSESRRDACEEARSRAPEISQPELVV